MNKKGFPTSVGFILKFLLIIRRPEKCKECGKEFITRTRLLNHEKKHLSKQDSYVIIDVFEIQHV